MWFSSAIYYLKFVHVHLMLLGFMAMMIYGIGYFIIPRFNAAVLKWPRAVVPHFWIANIALWGMVTAYSLQVTYDRTPFNVLFIVFGSMQALGIVMFVFNLILTIAGKKEEAKAAPAPQKKIEPVQIRGDMAVGDIVEKWPQARQILADSGLQAVNDDEHFEHIKQMGIPLRMACMRHGIDLNSLIRKLTKVLSGEEEEVAQDKPAAKQLQPPVVSEYIIGDVLASFPETQDVFRRYYGEGCFDCPGQSMETVAMSASLHNLDENEVLDALNEAISVNKKAN
jgi:iron-sulfur cluster repair protein YtfE (RIC family)